MTAEHGFSIADFCALEWYDDGRPLLEPGRWSPVVADPTYLFPDETPDGRWRLFAHTAWGIREHVSSDGISWRTGGIVVRNAMRAFTRRHEGRYLLAYERYRPLAMPMTVLPRRPAWRSRIELRWSEDLTAWGHPTTVVSPDRPWARDEFGSSVSNPCLVDVADGVRLYFSAGLVHVPDCGFEEPRYIGVAEAARPGATYTMRDEPVIDPATDPLAGVLGAGALTVIEMTDGWIGLQNKIYTDPQGHSRSALFLVRSADGLAWESVREEPLLAPSGSGWRSSHVYACDCRFRTAEGRWYLYYNARDAWRVTQGRERIGRLVAG